MAIAFSDAEGLREGDVSDTAVPSKTCVKIPTKVTTDFSSVKWKESFSERVVCTAASLPFVAVQLDCSECEEYIRVSVLSNELSFKAERVLSTAERVECGLSPRVSDAVVHCAFLSDALLQVGPPTAVRLVRGAAGSEEECTVADSEAVLIEVTETVYGRPAKVRVLVPRVEWSDKSDELETVRAEMERTRAELAAFAVADASSVAVAAPPAPARARVTSAAVESVSAVCVAGQDFAFEDSDVRIVSDQTQCSTEEAIRAMRQNNGDIVDAILSLLD